MSTKQGSPVPVASDLQGLICAFELAPLEARGQDILGDREARPAWLHFNLSDSRACRWLEQQTELPDAARELLLEPEARVQSLVLPGALVAVVGDLHHDYRGDPEDFGALRIYVDERRIITARSHPLKSSDRLRQDLLRGEVAPPSPLAVFEHLLDCLTETFAQTVAGLANDADDSEDEILAGRLHRQGRLLGTMRRLLARLRRQVTANRTALALLAQRKHTMRPGEPLQGVQAAVERFEAIAQDIELVQERARLLQEELAGRVGEATNRNLFVLSIATTALLPITLITGVFGMNVGGLPWVSDAAGFWWVILLMIAAVVVMLLILRRRSVL